ncbi:MAG: DUF309 domain-containing protein, partial [Aquificae bacterium]|nr:DUF309 domain-containing protein [Aquificota bacterium]
MSLSKERLVAHLADYFFELEKRKHYYKLVGNLLAVYEKGKTLNKSLLRRVKELLRLWVPEPSLVQLYARYLSSIEKEGVRSFGRAVGLLPLVNDYARFSKRFSEEADKWQALEGFLNSLDYCEVCFRGFKGEELFNCLLEQTDFLTATQLAGYLKDDEFLALDEFIAVPLEITKENYLKIVRPLRGEDLRLYYGALSTLLRLDRVKLNFVKELLGISRERELLEKAVKSWNEELFWEAHELFEELFNLFRNDEIRRCYRALVRSALA